VLSLKGILHVAARAFSSSLLQELLTGATLISDRPVNELAHAACEQVALSTIC